MFQYKKNIMEHCVVILFTVECLQILFYNAFRFRLRFYDFSKSARIILVNGLSSTAAISGK